MASLRLDDSNEACLAVAGDVAERFQAAVIGVVAAEFSPPPYFTAGTAAQRLVDEADAAVRRRFAELEDQFRTAMATRARQVEWRCDLSLPTPFVARQARAADIIVSGRSGRELSDPFRQADADDLVMRAGRPLLIIPPSARWLDVRSGLVAWKDCPEARRAIVDALPLLRKAKDVIIVAIAEPQDRKAGALAGARDVSAWLSRHGVTATELVPDDEGRVTEQLERIAANVGAGFIVAGAYGHSRFREWVLGGVTRHLLEHSDRCGVLAR
jgi:nucleotide-binding universal stress UspA family protein